MTIEITELTAVEILDSRGRPTIEVHLDAGTSRSQASVPSGASTGAQEAVERRDGSRERYHGAGVLCVIESIEREIRPALVNRRWASLEAVDAALCDLDGTPSKERLGANATVGVSMAAARAFADASRTPLWSWLEHPAPPRLPIPYFNVVNGGLHAANRLDFQEFMVAPIGAPRFSEALRAGAEIYACLRSLIAGSSLSTALGDEGGFSPALQAPEDVLDLLCQAISSAGYEAGRDVTVALDLAASQFRQPDGEYYVNGSHFDAVDLVEYLAYLVDRYPISSIEDAMAEDDPKGWEILTERLGSRVQLVGDDNLVTSPLRITEAIDKGHGTAALIKPNQVGTVSEAIEAVRRCFGGGFGAMVSHRSGETNDSFIADLATALGCGQVKAGAPARGERLAKYNRLLEIERCSPELPYGVPSA